MKNQLIQFAARSRVLLQRLVRLLVSDKWLMVGQVSSAILCYASFAAKGNWSASTWCSIAAIMSLMYYDKVRQKGATINQTDIEADEKLADAVETIKEYVRRRDVLPNVQAEPRAQRK